MSWGQHAGKARRGCGILAANWQLLVLQVAAVDGLGADGACREREDGGSGGDGPGAGRACAIGGHGGFGRGRPRSGYCNSPASMGTGRWFCAGGSGQSVWGLTAQGGL